MSEVRSTHGPYTTTAEPLLSTSYVKEQVLHPFILQGGSKYSQYVTPIQTSKASFINALLPNISECAEVPFVACGWPPELLRAPLGITACTTVAYFMHCECSRLNRSKILLVCRWMLKGSNPLAHAFHAIKTRELQYAANRRTPSPKTLRQE